MENKELIIQIPEGYEIDKEQSTFEKIVFKRKLLSTYLDICKKIFRTGFYYIENNGTIKEFDDADNIEYVIEKHPEILEQLNNAPTEEQLEQLLAINKLMNVAYYLNDGETLDFNDREQSKYYLFYDFHNKSLQVTEVYVLKSLLIPFKSKDLAWQAVAILGENTIKKALGV